MKTAECGNNDQPGPFGQRARVHQLGLARLGTGFRLKEKSRRGVSSGNPPRCSGNVLPIRATSQQNVSSFLSGAATARSALTLSKDIATLQLPLLIMREQWAFPAVLTSGAELPSEVSASLDYVAVTGAAITYLKLVTGGVKHHLCVADQALTEFVTLCGCVITQPQNWKRVNSLEGNECPRCADLAFGGSAPKATSGSQ